MNIWQVSFSDLSLFLWQQQIQSNQFEHYLKPCQLIHVPGFTWALCTSRSLSLSSPAPDLLCLILILSASFHFSQFRQFNVFARFR